MFQMDFTVGLHGDSEDQSHQKWGENRSPCSCSGSPHSHPGLEIFLGFGFSFVCTRAASGFPGSCGQKQLLGEVKLLHVWQPLLGLDSVGYH